MNQPKIFFTQPSFPLHEDITLNQSCTYYVHVHRPIVQDLCRVAKHRFQWRK